MEVVKNLNQNDVLVLFINGELTKIEVAAKLNVKKEAITEIITDLYKSGKIERNFKDKQLYYSIPEAGNINGTPESKPKATKKTTPKKAVAKKTESTDKPSVPTVKELVALIGKATTEDAVNDIIGDDKRQGVKNAAAKQIKKINTPPKKAKAKTVKKESKTPKNAPPVEFINDDGTVNYGKMTKLKIGDAAQFTPRGKKEETKGIIMLLDWSWWRSKLTIKLFVPSENKIYWKTENLLNGKMSAKDLKTFKSTYDHKELMKGNKMPKYQDWMRDMCLDALKGK